MRNPCYLRYNLILETEEKPKKTLESSNLSVKTSHGVYFRPSSEKKIISYSFQALESESKSSEALTAKDLPRLVAELDELQKKFDIAAVKKHKLQKELESCVQRLDSATLIINK